MINWMIRYRKITIVLKEVDRNFFCYYHPECTDDLDTPGAGAGNYIRFWFRVYLDAWLWDYGNTELWYLVLLNVSY